MFGINAEFILKTNSFVYRLSKQIFFIRQIFLFFIEVVFLIRKIFCLFVKVVFFIRKIL